MDLTDREGFSALHYAAESPDRNEYTLAELLLDAGANRTRMTRAGETPTMLAARWGKRDLMERLERPR